MFAANLTLGLYVHFGPKPLTPNSTIVLQSVALGGTELPLATPTNYVTLVPLLATMLFIMGRYSPRESLGLPPEGWLHGGLVASEGGSVWWVRCGGFGCVMGGTLLS